MQTVTDFRVYQSARDQGKRIGIPQRQAVHEVAEARKEGMSGQHVAGQMQHRAIRDQWPKHPGPSAA